LTPELSYHTSAILAATFDGLTLPWRLKNALSRHGLHDVISGLAVDGRKFAAAACAVPFPGNSHQECILLIFILAKAFLTFFYLRIMNNY
jgi:hypothetical protein